ncbi:MAG TPA: DUF6702 family protein [Chitinophagaceae bacterium]|jgi:hypothetical protein
MTKSLLMAMITFNWLLTLFLGLIHPFFVSMTDINYNSKEKELEISVRIFTDDLENTLRKYHSTDLDILHPADIRQMNSFVNDYIQKHLLLNVNGSSAQMSFLGYEEQSESIWSYFEVKSINNVQKLNITNSLLHDYNTNQVNMIHVKANDKEYSTKLDYPDTSASFSF